LRAPILVIEDERRIGAFLAQGLRVEGFPVRLASGGGEALAALDELDPAVVLLDLRLPDLDGLQLLDSIRRRRPSALVMVVSAVRDIETRLACLRGGACDYVTKPFSFDELLERIGIHLASTGRGASTVMYAGTLRLNPRTREADLGAGPVRLSEREYMVLERLAQQRGEVVSRERLLGAVWGYSFLPHTNVLDVCVKRLRDKLGSDCIETVRNVGYRLLA
jgi:DNA-binding response OmpR family regulator